MVELLVVVGIIALLIGLLIPATSMVRKTAKEVKQKAQFTAIDLGLAAFKNDYGDYPPSEWLKGDRTYSGAQTLAEAMVGWDMMGFHPNSAWRSDGLDANGGPMSYDPIGAFPARRDANGDLIADTLTERKDAYIDSSMANAFHLGDSALGANDGLFPDGRGIYGSHLAENTFVLCDAFTSNGRRIKLQNGNTVSAGTPILYYRADTASKLMLDAAAIVDDTSKANSSIYNARDNQALVLLGKLADRNKPVTERQVHPLKDFGVFYEFIRDPKVTAQPWPYKPDSYILISAGYDGLYGTEDDICNFPR